MQDIIYTKEKTVRSTERDIVHSNINQNYEKNKLSTIY